MERLKEFFQKHRAGVVQVAVVLFLGLFAYGVYQGATYTWPMHRGAFHRASQSKVGDKPTALYDSGLQAYQAQEYEAAKSELTAAYSACTDDAGLIPGSRKQLCAQIQFLLGNTYVNLKKVQSAIQAYEESLRLDPTNLYAKYNLELLKSQSAGGGGGDQGNPGGSGKGGGKKGI
ncbi:MAG TPA: tetratricopeptide repeat protein [Candidatus Acidoferrales bacterium]|nr:tetratricopeptide repeat protein [Candidatus Acidoferrales bacterium]